VQSFGQSRHDLTPAARMKTGGVEQQQGRPLACLTPFKPANLARRRRETMLNGNSLHY